MTGINRQPVGLSDLLQVQAGGQNPDELSQLVRGIMDLYPFYQPDRIRGWIEPWALSVGQAEFVEVPAGEMWLLEFLAVEVDSSTSSADDYYFSFGIERIIGQGLNGIQIISTGVLNGASSAAAARPTGGGMLPRVFPITSGQRITCRLDDENQAGAITGNFFGVYTLVNV